MAENFSPFFTINTTHSNHVSVIKQHRNDNSDWLRKYVFHTAIDLEVLNRTMLLAQLDLCCELELYAPCVPIKETFGILYFQALWLAQGCVTKELKLGLLSKNFDLFATCIHLPDRGMFRKQNYA